MWNFISLWEATRAKKLFIIYPVTRAYSNCWIYSITWVSRRICHVPLPVSPQSLSYFYNQSLTWVSLSISQDFGKVRTWQSHVSYILEHEDQTQSISYPSHSQDRPARNFYTNINKDIFFLLLFNIFKAIWKLSKVVKETAIFIM